MSVLQSVCPERKWRDHLDRANALADALPPWEWIDSNGVPESFIWLLEVLDGLNALVQFVDHSNGGVRT